MAEFDKILQQCGNSNKFQYFLLLLFGLVMFMEIVDYFNQTIISFTPEYWCFDESYENLTVKDIKRLKSLQDENNITTSDSIGKCKMRNRTCDKWIYDLDYEYKSVTVEFNWICDNEWKSALVQSMYFVGASVGTFFFGVLADKIGRSPIVVLSGLMHLIGNIVNIYSKSVPVFSTGRFIAGLGCDCDFMMLYIIVMDYVSPRMRTVGINLCMGMAELIACVSIPWIAVYVKSWKTYLWIASAPFLLYPLLYLVVPESFEWLLTKRKYDKVKEILKKVAKGNKKEVPDQVLDEFISMASLEMEDSKEDVNLIDFLKISKLRWKFIIICFKSMVVALVYDVVGRNVENLNISPFIVFSMNGFALIPATLIIIFLQDRIGRRKIIAGSLIFSGVSISLVTIIFLQFENLNSPFLVIPLVMMCRCAVVVAVNAEIQFSTELVPVCIRGQGVAVIHVSSLLVIFLSPYILWAPAGLDFLPEVVIFVISFFAASLNMFLPETHNKKLPCTLEDAIDFYSARAKTESTMTLK